LILILLENNYQNIENQTKVMKENVKLMLYIQAIKNNIEKKSLNKRF